jgi:hypothetical protein
MTQLHFRGATAHESALLRSDQHHGARLTDLLSIAMFKITLVTQISSGLT